MRALLAVVVFIVACSPPATLSPTPPSVTPATTPPPVQTTGTATATSAAQPTGLAVANSRAYVADGRIIIPAFRTRFPARYVATSGDMVTPYDTQGGISPPLLILSVGAQPLADEQRWREVLRSNADCVVVWGTNGFTTLAEWHASVARFVEGVAIAPRGAERSQRVGAWDVVLQDVLFAGTTVRTAALVRMPGTLTFYVHSCNEPSGRDVLTVIENLAVASR